MRHERPSSVPLVVIFVAGSIALAMCAGVAYVTPESTAPLPYWLLLSFALFFAVMGVAGAFLEGQESRR